MNYLTKENIDLFIDNALKEDVGSGDHSSLSSIPSDAIRKAQLIIKDKGIIAGVELAEKIFHAVNSDLSITYNVKDGDEVVDGQIGFIVEGNAQSILTSERLVLNCMQRMSGIATYAHSLQSMIAHTKATVLDTRKTTPNARLIEKWAVKIGGGTNHRYGLYDMIMLKDNHVDYCGGVKQAVEQCKKYIADKGLDINIEVEVRNLEELSSLLETTGVFRVLLDNMSPHEMSAAVKMVNGKMQTEASGGITEQTISLVAQSGVDYISIGALTHSYKSLDMSLKAI